MSYIRVLVIMALPAFITACSGWFFVRASGRLSEGVDFCFYNKATDKQPSEVNIQQLLVQQRTDNSKPMWDSNSWRTIWVIAGPYRAKCITYGAEAGTLHTINKALPLSLGSEYRVELDDYSGPVRNAGTIFKINADGVVVPAS